METNVICEVLDDLLPVSYVQRDSGARPFCCTLLTVEFCKLASRVNAELRRKCSAVYSMTPATSLEAEHTLLSCIALVSFCRRSRKCFEKAYSRSFVGCYVCKSSFLSSDKDAVIKPLLVTLLEHCIKLLGSDVSAWP